MEFVKGAGEAALQDGTYNLAHRPYHSPHPVAYGWGQMTGHAVSTVAGVVKTAGAIPLTAAGIALSGTGVGAAVGAPATAIAAMGAAHGADLATTGSSHFVQHANELYQRMSRGEGVSEKAVKGTGSSQAKQNKAKGDAFEQEVINKISSEPANNVRQQITVKTKSGVKTRIDIISTNSQTGQIRCIECKASSTAPLTKNQKKAFPEIEQSGAIVVGKGKTPYNGGTKISPTKIEIIRKK
ncbi:hypothetical protein [Geobacillus sp. YF-1]|uniref:hypothetical protein n=1 Tax=Geobacillus sp. YF-1 TaxID=3457480 RepID=UPI004045A94A